MEGDLSDIKKKLGPDWCGSVDWVPACKPKKHQFNSQSGHMLGFRAKSPVGGMREEPYIDAHIDVSLPLFLPPFPSV